MGSLAMPPCSPPLPSCFSPFGRQPERENPGRAGGGQRFDPCSLAQPFRRRGCDNAILHASGKAQGLSSLSFLALNQWNTN